MLSRVALASAGNGDHTAFNVVGPGADDTMEKVLDGVTGEGLAPSIMSCRRPYEKIFPELFMY